MPSSVFILTTTPFAKESIPLGSLVPDRSTPSTDLWTADGIGKHDYSRVKDKNFDGLISSESETWFELLLSNVLSVSLRAEHTAKFHVTADRGYVYLLQEPREIFKRTVAREDTKRWLEDGYRDKLETWFVVGLRTFIDASLQRHTKKSGETSAKTKAPISEGLGDGTGSADVGGSGGHKGSVGVKADLETVGERIYAICYRRVKVSLIRGEISAKLVPGNVWKSFMATRGNAEQDDDYLEADIEELDDVEGCVVKKGTIADGEEVVFAIPPELQ